MPHTIQLTNLSRTFQRGENDVHALRNVDLAIETGEFVALVGPSGSGKSTLLNLLGGLDSASEGELWLDGVPFHDISDKERTSHRRQRVGFVFQSFNLLPRLTALENVAVPLMLAGVPQAEREARAQTILEQVGLGHRLNHYPTELSGGEQQRTAIARAIIHEPAIVLADEPTGNLDSATGREIMTLLQNLNAERGVTLILVTHDPEIADYANSIVRLRDGQIEAIEQNRPARVRTSVSSVQSSASNLQSLRFSDMATSALRNLRRRPIRNVLTVMGVLIGIITLVAMVSFGVGVQREVQRNFETVGLENVFVSPRFSEERDEFDPFAEPETVNALTPELVEEIRTWPDVASVTPELNLPPAIDLSLTWEGEVLGVRVFRDFQVPEPFSEGEALLAGSELEGDNPAGALLSRSLADTLLNDSGDYESLIGQEIVLTARLPRGETGDFVIPIVGVQPERSGNALNIGLANRVEITAWWFGQPDILQTEGYDSLTVRAVNLGAVQGIQEQLEAIDLDSESLETFLDVANQVLSLLQALLGSVGGLALLVAALGVANTMMMAIYERTREIGVLKALGASAREIRTMFTIEAALIGFLGGIFGLILGTLLGRLIDWVGHRYLISEGVTGVGDLSVVPLWLALGALLFASLIGIVAGLYPAGRAAKLDPVTALRHE